MNIWFDPVLFAQGTPELKGKKGGDCDPDGCGCDLESTRPDSIPPVRYSLTAARQKVHQVYGHTISLAPTLYFQTHTDSYWIACTPTGEGRLAVLDVEAYRFLQRFRQPQVLRDFLADDETGTKERLVALLLSLGFLHDLDQPAPALVQEESQTLSAWLHITNACNLRCSYCYVSKTSEHMLDETAKRSVDAILRSALAYHYRFVHLTFAGGESTLRLPEVLATYDYALACTREHDLELSASIISNGTALPLRAIEQIKQRGMRLMISLDGVGIVHDKQRPLINGQGSFAFVERTIARLLAASLLPYINVTVTRRNLDNLPTLLAYLLENDLPFGLSYYRENECSTHLADLQFTEEQMICGIRAAFAYIEKHLPRRPLLGALIDKASIGTPRQYSCGVGRNYMVIDQRGGVAKCQVEMGETVTTIDAENPLHLIRVERKGVQAVAVDDKEGCRQCQWRYWCRGGCSMLTYRITGRSDIRSPNCGIYRALFPDALRLEALRLLTYEQPFVL